MKSSWLESKTMFFLFSCSAWVVVCLGIFMVLSLIVWGQQTKSFQTTNNVIGVTLAALMVVIMIAILVIILGMAIHCLSNGDFSIGTKILWSIFAFFTAPFGATLYFFTVYKKQRKIHREVANA
jgi:multisubunit Na+/H+ antiporter MnhG subunit